MPHFPSICRCVEISALAISLLLTGCASSYFVKVRSEQSERLNTALYYHIENIHRHPLYLDLYEEANAILTEELSETGMIKAADRESAQIIIRYRFNVTEHVEERVRYRGTIPALRTDLSWRAGTRRNSDGKYQIGEMTSRTDFGKSEMELKVVAYVKRLTLEAWMAPTVPAEQRSDKNRVWRVEASIADAQGDFYMILPLLANAVVEQLSVHSPDSQPQYVKYKTPYDKPDPFVLIFTEVNNESPQ